MCDHNSVQYFLLVFCLSLRPSGKWHSYQVSVHKVHFENCNDLFETNGMGIVYEQHETKTTDVQCEINSFLSYRDLYGWLSRQTNCYLKGLKGIKKSVFYIHACSNIEWLANPKKGNSLSQLTSCYQDLRAIAAWNGAKINEL